MRCHGCGADMEQRITDLPFKVGPTTIIIIKNLPVIQCTGCREYLLDDQVMERVDHILERVDESSELEVLKYAA